MKHGEYVEWLKLYLYDELSDDEKKLVDRHLSACKECQKEFEELQELHKLFKKHPQLQIKEELLQDARLNLHMKIRELSIRKTFWLNVKDNLNSIVTPKVKLAISGVAVLIVGILLGYIVFSLVGRDYSGMAFIKPVMDAGETKVSNFRFVEKDIKTGNVEFRFDAVVPVHVRGNIEDENVQKIITRALISEENVGTRLRAISMLGMKGKAVRKDNLELENEIKSVLIMVLLNDENLRLRREALNALKQYLPDPDVTRAFLKVVRNEKNISLKISAINSLNINEYKDRPLRGEMIELLKQTAQSDENNYIKILAKTTLKEIEQ